jgi:ATP-dependent DNA helicase RecQ
LNEILEEDILTDIYDYFKTNEAYDLEEAFKEFKEDDVPIEDIQLVRIKFVSEMGN